MPVWDSDQYLRFADERTQPSRDLVARISLAAPERIVDAGCGPGNSTAILAARWPEARIEGFDTSTGMLAQAKAGNGAIHWYQQDVSDWTPQDTYDLIYSNAVLQWVPNHAELFPRLVDALTEGGMLAVQMPAHQASPTHQVMLEVARRPEWRALTKAACEAIRIEPPAFYYDLLAPRCERVEMWHTEYLHLMADAAAIVSWFEGTGMRPFLEALPDEAARDEFRAAVLAGYTAAFPPQSDGRVLMPFRRFFLLAG